MLNSCFLVACSIPHPTNIRCDFSASGSNPVISSVSTLANVQHVSRLLDHICISNFVLNMNFTAQLNLISTLQVAIWCIRASLEMDATDSVMRNTALMRIFPRVQDLRVNHHIEFHVRHPLKEPSRIRISVNSGPDYLR
jgi:hypothetical protein